MCRSRGWFRLGKAPVCPAFNGSCWRVLLILALTAASGLSPLSGASLPGINQPVENTEPQTVSAVSAAPVAPEPPILATLARNGGAATVVTSTVPMPQFSTWPVPPPLPLRSNLTHRADKSADQASMPQIADDKKLYSFRAEGLELKSALALFARANKLNIVPDEDVTGQVTLDIQDLPLKKMMQALLEAHDFTWEEHEQLIRVHAKVTRLFSVDYLRMHRKGIGSSSATLSSASAGGGGSSGGSSGGGGGGGGAAGGGGGAGAGAGNGNVGGSAISLSQENLVDFWTELKEQLEKIVTPAGKESLAVNMTAGLIQVTDRPSAVRRVEKYLEKLGNSVQRQVDIEAKIYEVTLSSQFNLGLDWSRIIGDSAVIAGDTIVPGGGAASAVRAANALGEPLKNRNATLGMVFKNANTKVILEALNEQGTLNVISQPRLRALNNQTALIKVGRDQPFFSQTTYFLPTSGGNGNPTTTTTTDDNYQTITIGTILSITPQISEDGEVALDISPVISSLLDTLVSPSGTTTAPVLDIKQVSTLVRVTDGDTIVIGGLIQSSKDIKIRKIPLISDIPLLGKLFQGKNEETSRRELVIFITPHVVVTPPLITP